MKNFLIILLVLIGILVAMMSVYTASIEGVMGKMGLVGGDFNQAIDRNVLARTMLENGSEADFSLYKVARKVPAYLLSKGQDRVRFASELGTLRINCGIQHIQRGNVERGVYTIIKGLYYLRSHYTELRLMVEVDKTKCNLMVDGKYESVVDGYLNSSDGRVHELVKDVYSQVQGAKSRVQELCID